MLTANPCGFSIRKFLFTFILSSTLILPVILFQQRCSSLPPLWHEPRFMHVQLNVFIRNVGEIFQFFRHVSWFRKHAGYSSLSIVFLTRQTPSHSDLGEGERISLWNFNFLHECSHMNVPYFHCSRCYRINIRVRETSKSVGICVRLCVSIWTFWWKTKHASLFNSIMCRYGACMSIWKYYRFSCYIQVLVCWTQIWILQILMIWHGFYN